jgi:hypothetical protein
MGWDDGWRRKKQIPHPTNSVGIRDDKWGRVAASGVVRLRVAFGAEETEFVVTA